MEARRLQLEQEVEELDASSGWLRLFCRLQEHSDRCVPKHDIGQLPQNKYKNRYIDVFPIDQTRVLLQGKDGDYINANHVMVKETGQRYILTQGPIQQTCSDFWQMVWEQQAPGIVMLSQFKELWRGELYWPAVEYGASTMNHGPFSITVKSADKKPFCTFSQLEITKTDSPSGIRAVTHMHFTKWPDYGVPESPHDFLAFREQVRKTGLLESSEGPCVIHCVGGVGRSGTFTLVDATLRKVEKEGGSVDSVAIGNMLQQLRKQRYWLVQTPEQLQLAFRSILEGCRSVSK